MNCAKCQYWDEINRMQGQCRRSAPVPYHETGKITATWCITAYDAWCGEFKKDALEAVVERDSFEEIKSCKLSNGKDGYLGVNGRCYARKGNAENSFMDK